MKQDKELERDNLLQKISELVDGIERTHRAGFMVWNELKISELHKAHALLRKAHDEYFEIMICQNYEEREKPNG